MKKLLLLVGLVVMFFANSVSSLAEESIDYKDFDKIFTKFQLNDIATRGPYKIKYCKTNSKKSPLISYAIL